MRVVIKAIGAGKRFHFKGRRVMGEDMMLRWVLTILWLVSVAASAQEATPTPAPAPSTAEKPSAELIIDAEETVIKEPALEPGEQPLPLMDTKIPGEQDIFGDDLFNPSSAGGAGLGSATLPRIPPPLPVLEDPLEKERKMRIRLRQIKALLDRDARLIELENMAVNAPTPDDYRAARRAYYALFFDKVRRADSTLKDYADRLEKESLAGLFQSRVEPTQPLREPPRPLPSARFLPPKQYPLSLPADEQPVRLP
jgi:hypothetical protein